MEAVYKQIKQKQRVLRHIVEYKQRKKELEYEKQYWERVRIKREERKNYHSN